MIGGSEPVRFSVFWQVTTANGVDPDFDTYGADGAFTTGHDAFLVDEAEFDAIFDRIRASGVAKPG